MCQLAEVGHFLPRKRWVSHGDDRLAMSFHQLAVPRAIEHLYFPCTGRGHSVVQWAQVKNKWMEVEEMEGLEQILLIFLHDTGELQSSDAQAMPHGCMLCLLVACEQAKKGILGKVDELFNGKKQMESDLEKPKPWILW
eukprot:1158874-Pelagomonas_calceolata.AAC.7